MEQKKNTFPYLSFFILILLAVVASSNIFAFITLNERIIRLEENIVNNANNPQPTESSQSSLEQIFIQANPSVVGIGILSGFNSETIIGTGFVVSEDGHIATNQHVVSETGVDYYVKFPDDENIYEVNEVFRDAVNDIAVVTINKDNLEPLTLGNSLTVTPGEQVVAIGNPLGELNSTVTSGIVSAINRTVNIGGRTFLRTDVNRFEDTIQTDAAINPGNSGGPLLNTRGEVIGINFATIVDANNLSFAIPISYLQDRLDELETFGNFRISYVGISYEMNAYRLDNQVVIGAEVITVDPEGSAVGLLEPGDIITTFDGVDLSDDSLFRLIQTQDIGEIVEFEFYRDGIREESEIEIVER